MFRQEEITLNRTMPERYDKVFHAHTRSYDDDQTLRGIRESFGLSQDYPSNAEDLDDYDYDDRM